MTAFQTPYYVGGSASGWVLADYQSLTQQSQPASGGMATIELPQLDGDERWLIDHAVISSTSTTPTELRWYDSAALPLYFLDGSSAGNFDVGEWPSGLQLSPSRSLLMVWTGCSAGAVATANLQARVLRRS